MVRTAAIYAGLAPFLVIALFPVVWIRFPPMDQKVVTVGLPTMLIRGDIYFWGSLMAGALLVGVPAALAFNLASSTASSTA